MVGLRSEKTKNEYVECYRIKKLQKADKDDLERIAWDVYEKLLDHLTNAHSRGVDAIVVKAIVNEK